MLLKNTIMTPDINVRPRHAWRIAMSPKCAIELLVWYFATYVMQYVVPGLLSFFDNRIDPDRTTVPFFLHTSPGMYKLLSCVLLRQCCQLIRSHTLVIRQRSICFGQMGLSSIRHDNFCNSLFQECLQPLPKSRYAMFFTLPLAKSDWWIGNKSKGNITPIRLSLFWLTQLTEDPFSLIYQIVFVSAPKRRENNFFPRSAQNSPEDSLSIDIIETGKSKNKKGPFRVLNQDSRFYTAFEIRWEQKVVI